MNWRAVIAVARKDLREATQNKSVWLPMLIVPLIFVVLFPLAMIMLPSMLGAQADVVMADPDLEQFLANMPPAFQQTLEGLSLTQSTLVLMLGYIFAPMFLIFPLMFSTVIAAESFAGERERKTIEALLYTPTSDVELFLGKVLAGLVPAVVISWGSFLAYIVVLNTAGWSIFQRIWFPLPSWYPLIFWVGPALALMGVSVTVLISAKNQTFMGAYQTSASLVILVVGLLIGQLTGLLYLSVPVGLVIGLVMWGIAGVLTWRASKGFNRVNLLSSQKG